MDGLGDTDGSGELQCVGRLEIVRPKPVFFLCGSLPVPTDKAFHAFNSALVPSSQRVRAPRYRMLPTETDLNSLPLLPNIPEKVLPIGAVQCKTSGDLHWESNSISSNISRKGEALAVSSLAEYGDEIDVVAPADIVKQIFKMPYSKARLSIAVHRIGQTLVLNTGPDVEEGEKLVRRHSNQSKCVDQSLFLNFAMHSVRVEACDCPPGQYVPPEEKPNSTVLPGKFEPGEGFSEPYGHPLHGDTTKFFGQSYDTNQKEGLDCHEEHQQASQDSFLWSNKKNKKNNRYDAVKKVSQVSEKSRCPTQEPEKYRRVTNDGFLRVLFWQFHNFRMLLGSDLLLFSNEKFVAVSLHLWDVARQVTPLTWLEAWLDNVMASVPELAICYHQNGVVQGYELLKTDDIFLLKGISEDGTPAFHPQVVQQNGLSVLRFLQDNCTQDPGAYWLYKSAGEDMIQLFDLSVIPKNHSTEEHDDRSSSLPSLLRRGRNDSLFSLGTLLYRVAHRISLSMNPKNRAKCARLFQKCFDFLDEQDHLVVRALAHEQFARLLLTYNEELQLTFESVPVDSEVIVTDVEDKSADFLPCISESVVDESSCFQVAVETTGEDRKVLPDPILEEPSTKITLEANIAASRKLIATGDSERGEPNGVVPRSSCEDSLAVCHTSATSGHVIQTVSDPISSKLAAIHHVSQAIKSLRWMRQLHGTEFELLGQDSGIQDGSPSNQFHVCACGDADCIEVCDIREWLPRSKVDHKLWKLVLLLGESYLALGNAYKEDDLLHQALKVVGLACSLYGSMPQHLEDAQFISSMICGSSSHLEFNDTIGTRSFLNDKTKSNTSSIEDSRTVEQFSSTYLFWAKAWTLVGDVYVDYHMRNGKEISMCAERISCKRDMRISPEVVKEVKRLNKKLGKYKQNCNACSLINCSCQSDRASSGNSASSSSVNVHPLAYGRKHSKRSNAKNSPCLNFEHPQDDYMQYEVEHGNDSERGCALNNRDDDNQASNPTTNKIGKASSSEDSTGVKGTSEMQNVGSTVATGSEPTIKESLEVKSGGIFKFLEGPVVGNVEYNLSAAITCYNEARKAIDELTTDSTELQSVLKKKGWVCNELGRIRIERKDLEKAELAFSDAISAFKEVSDHTNIILIYFNLGHGRRAVAEEIVSKMENLRGHTVFHNLYNQFLESAKLEYSESLKYYGAARSELNTLGEGTSSVSCSLSNEVFTQYAHTYLRFGMLLAKEDSSAYLFEIGAIEDLSIGYVNPGKRKTRKELGGREISANDAIREALCMYESLGELRKQEVAYAYFQLACYHRDCCSKFLDPESKKTNLSRGDSGLLQKVKQYASLAERNWQKSIDYYGPKTHPVMYLTILIERSALLLRLSNCFRSSAMLESSLSCLLEGRHVSKETTTDSLISIDDEVYCKFWNQLQLLLKRMLAGAPPGSSNKTSTTPPATPTSNKPGDVGKLRELYRMSLKSIDMSQLHAMYTLWMS